MDILAIILAPSLLLLLVGWLLKKLIVNRLALSVRYEFDAKLANLQAELKDRESQLRHQLTVYEEQLKLVLGGALTNITTRQASISAKRLEGVDFIWRAVNDLSPLKFSSRVMEKIHYETALKFAETDPKLRALFKQFSLPDEALKDALEKVRGVYYYRPYVSPLLWSYFQAYQSILHISVVQIELIKHGAPDFAKTDDLIAILKTTLPHHSTFIDEHGIAAIHFLVEELEGLILEEITKTLDTSKIDNADLERAAKIQMELNKHFSMNQQ